MLPTHLHSAGLGLHCTLYGDLRQSRAANKLAQVAAVTSLKPRVSTLLLSKRQHTSGRSPRSLLRITQQFTSNPGKFPLEVKLESFGDNKKNCKNIPGNYGRYLKFIRINWKLEVSISSIGTYLLY